MNDTPPPTTTTKCRELFNFDKENENWRAYNQTRAEKSGGNDVLHVCVCSFDECNAHTYKKRRCIYDELVFYQLLFFVFLCVHACVRVCARGAESES